MKRASTFAPLLVVLLAALPALARAQSNDEYWHLLYMDDAKIGFIHGTKEPADAGGKKYVRRNVDSSLTINRLGVSITMLVTAWSLEDANAEVVELNLEQNLSASKTIQHLVRDGDKATLETRIGGPTQKRTIDWNKEWLSETAVEALKRAKLAAGEKEFTYSAYDMQTGETTVTTKVVGRERVDVRGVGSQELLHVLVTNTAMPMPTDAWLDEKYDEVMTVTKVMGFPMTTVRSDQATCVAAFAKPDTPEIFEKISPRTNVRLPNPYHTDELVLHIRANDADTPMPKLEDERQKIVEKKDDRDVTLKVSRVVPTGTFTLPLANLTDEEKECLEPSPQIQFDDVEFNRLAKNAVGDEKDAWKAAQKLERFAFKYISNKGMDKLFESATDVMKSKSGDCTEHGVFLAGLCRAVGIPARVAVGFLYFQGIWGGHMWTEVSLGGKWYAIDGVLGQGSVDAAHLRLGADSLKTMQIDRAFQGIALGMTMKIDVVSFRHGEREVRIGQDFKPFTVDDQKFTSTIYDFTLEAPEGFTVKPNSNISLHDLLVVEFEREGGGARVDVTDVNYSFTLDEAKDHVAAGGVSRIKAEDKKLDGRPARIFRGKKEGGDVLVAAVIDGQTLIMITLPKHGDGDEAHFDAILDSLKFSQPMAAAAAGSGS
jgi:hypothetical protein